MGGMYQCNKYLAKIMVLKPTYIYLLFSVAFLQGSGDLH